MLSHLPAVIVDRESVRRISLGAAVKVGGILSKTPAAIASKSKIRLYDTDNRLLAIGEACLDFNDTDSNEPFRIAFKPQRVLV